MRISNSRRGVWIGLCAAGILGAAGAQPALASERTTAPATTTSVIVALGNNKITIAADQFSRKGETIYPRGAIIDFNLTNIGKQAVSVRIKVLSKTKFAGPLKYATFTPLGRAIRPKSLRHFKVNFFYRGSFVMQMLVHGKVRASTPIRIV